MICQSTLIATFMALVSLQTKVASAAPLDYPNVFTDGDGEWVFQHFLTDESFAGVSMSMTVTDGSGFPVEVEWVVGTPAATTWTHTDTEYPPLSTQTGANSDLQVVVLDTTNGHPVTYTETKADHMVVTTWTGHPDGHPEIEDLFVLEDVHQYGFIV